MRARTNTCLPFAGRTLTNWLRFLNIAHLTCAASSLSEKYQCPEAGRAKFESSASIHNKGKPVSNTVRTSRFKRETVYMSRLFEILVGASFI